jgi:hypothetical protein
MNKTVQGRLRNVLDVMKRIGFGIDEPIDIVVDENLPFMGYTSRQWRRHVIVVSGFATKTAMFDGLLAHELSHVYRNLTNHPSHNERVITRAAGSFIQRNNLNEDYQREALHQAINHIQDLYADDIAVKVMVAIWNATAALGMLGEFFLGWIRQEPVESGTRLRNSWNNAGILLNNCFAVSNLQRREATKYVEEAVVRNEVFLQKIRGGARRSFSYFNRFMVGLKEDVDEEEFQRQLTDYLSHFREVIDAI